MKSLLQQNNMEKSNYKELGKEVKQNKLFWFSIFLMILSVILYCFKIPSKELYVLGSFLFLVIVVIFKFIK